MRTERSSSSWLQTALRAAPVCAVLWVGCGRAEPPPKAPERPTAPGPVAAEPSAPGVTARATEQHGSNVPAPAAPEVDGGAQQPYHGQPQMVLDEGALADVRKAITATSDLLEQGVTILEAHKAKPEKAADALRAWLDKHRAHVDEVLRSAQEVRIRLAAAGYDQDIPAEVRTEFEARMSSVQKRLELMRAVYRDHVDALEAFGGFFPRIERKPQTP